MSTRKSPIKRLRYIVHIGNPSRVILAVILFASTSRVSCKLYAIAVGPTAVTVLASELCRSPPVGHLLLVDLQILRERPHLRGLSRIGS